jgi:CP family cyanate transporter-like MFS transporter
LRAVRGLHRDRLAWQVTGYMALQSFSFYATTSWLPSLFADHGISDSRAGLLLAISSIAGIPSAIGIPVLAARARTQQQLMAYTMALWLAGLLGLLVAPTAAAPLWMMLLGLAQGSSLGLALTLIVLRSPDSEHAAQLSSMAQGIGYTVAGFGPFALGALHDATNGWTVPLLLLIAIVAPQLVLGLGASRDLRVGTPGPGPETA